MFVMKQVLLQRLRLLLYLLFPKFLVFALHPTTWGDLKDRRSLMAGSFKFLLCDTWTGRGSEPIGQERGFLSASKDFVS